jgi:hypothetical protein
MRIHVSSKPCLPYNSSKQQKNTFFQLSLNYVYASLYFHLPVLFPGGTPLLDRGKGFPPHPNPHPPHLHPSSLGVGTKNEIEGEGEV